LKEIFFYQSIASQELREEILPTLIPGVLFDKQIEEYSGVPFDKQKEECPGLLGSKEGRQYKIALDRQHNRRLLVALRWLQRCIYCVFVSVVILVVLCKVLRF
jgi:hypothetical protein